MVTGASKGPLTMTGFTLIVSPWAGVPPATRRNDPKSPAAKPPREIINRTCFMAWV